MNRSILNNTKKKVCQINQDQFKDIKSYIENNDLSRVHGFHKKDKKDMSTKIVFNDGEFLEKKRSKGNSIYFVTEDLFDTYRELSDFDYRQASSSF